MNQLKKREKSGINLKFFDIYSAQNNVFCSSKTSALCKRKEKNRSLIITNY